MLFLSNPDHADGARFSAPTSIAQMSSHFLVARQVAGWSMYLPEEEIEKDQLSGYRIYDVSFCFTPRTLKRLACGGPDDLLLNSFFTSAP